MRLISDVVHEKCKNTATIQCGNINLCAGLPAGIEGSLHAVRKIWPHSAGWTHDDGVEVLHNIDEEDHPELAGTSTAANDTGIDPGVSEDDELDRYEPNTGFGAGLYDAANAFGSMNRYLMLWEVAHRWNKASRFAFNRYRHHGLVFVRDNPGKPAIVLHLKEGVSQGCVFSMDLYAVGLLPLAEGMRAEIPEALQPWFADDSGSAGRANDNARCLKYLCVHGPQYGYFPEPEKSWYVCKLRDEEVAKAAFAALGLTIQMTRGKRYLGGFLGSETTKHLWLNEMVEGWTQTVEILAKIAVKFPQTVYAGFTFCLQNKWQYVQRVTSDTGAFFAPLEAAIRKHLAPAFMGIDPGDVDGDFRQVLTHGVKMGGMALRNPVDTASYVHEASKETTSHLISSLIEPGVRFSVGRHKSVATEARGNYKSERLQRELAYLGTRGEGKPATKRRDKRNSRAGLWLSVIPSRINGTWLSANEWRDNVRLCYNLQPLDMPQLCDGCQAPMSVEHALSCKCGGLVHIRHDDVADEWRHLCGTATTFGRVSREP